MYKKEDLTSNYKREDFVFFHSHRPSGRKNITKTCLSQWFPCKFRDDERTYNCAEQYMMYHKAVLFGDKETAELIMRCDDPRIIKEYGRRVRHFDSDVWESKAVDIVTQGNYLKFSQNEDLCQYLMSTGDAILVEAAPKDCIWGIGLSEDADNAVVPRAWRGTNWLGFSLMTVRDALRHKIAYSA